MLSVVIPVYNEGAVLGKTASVICGVLSDAAIGCASRVAAVCRDRRCIDVHGVRRRRVHHAARDASAPETGG